MHFSYFSSTLPRKWKMSSTEGLNYPPQTPKSSGKPPKSNRKLSSSSKFPKRSSILGRSHSMCEKPVVMNGEFKVPLPVLPPPNSAKNVAIKLPLRPHHDFPLKSPSSNSLDSFSSFNRDWRSQSMTDLKRSSSSSLVTNRSLPFRTSWGPRTNCAVSSSCDGLNKVESPSPAKPLATIFSKNLRSNSWRNLSTIGRVEAEEQIFGGMNRSHRLSQGAKKVTPPSVPGFNPRASSSSFGSDYSAEREDSISQLPEGVTSTVNGYSHIDSVSYTERGSSYREKAKSAATGQHSVLVHVMDDQGIDMTLSPGRDSPGDDSSASIVTVESTSSGGCRNSTTSLDSGRASNSASNSTTTDSSFHSIHPIKEHPYGHIRGPQTLCPPPTGRISSVGSTGSSFRQSYHSSSSSLGSAERTEDSICALDIPEMFSGGVPDHDILLAWLTDLHHEEYYDLFVDAGYDMPTISRMTPEDLTAIGIKKPNHRKRLKAEISKLTIPDGLPQFIPNTLEDFLQIIRLSEYGAQFRCQGYMSVDDVAQISIEDFEDVGLYKLGHQKRFLLAIKRIKDIKAGRFRPTQPMQSFKMPTQPIYQSHEYRVPPNQQSQPPQQYYTQPRQQHYQAPDNGIYSQRNNIHDRVGNPAPAGNMVSFQQVTSSHNSSFPLPPPSPALSTTSFRPTYQPDIVRIENRPSSQLAGNFQQRHNSIGSGQCPPTPSPPPSPSPPTSLTMPQPMPPLPSYTRYQQNFGPMYNGGNGPWGGMMRSYDDHDIYRRGSVGGDQNTIGASVVVHQPMNSANFSATGGGTLPRPKGMVKPRPVAKIVASTRDNVSQSSSSLSDVDPKSKMASFSPKKFPHGRSDSYEAQGNSETSLNEIESFPFANDNVGTIRMRPNGQGPMAQDDDLPLPPPPQQQQQHRKMSEGSLSSKSSSHSLPQRQPGTQRSAGDVLNDIGSMLADLTDELDAMLHMEAKN